MIAIKNVSNLKCIESLKRYLDTETKTITIYLIGENDSGITDFDPVEMKKILPEIESRLTDDFHGIINYIQNGLDNKWFLELLETPETMVFKFYILMEYIQMTRYRNPGINLDHPTIIIYHLKDQQSKDVHCQIVGSAPVHPSHPDFFKFYKSSVRTFMDCH